MHDSTCTNTHHQKSETAALSGPVRSVIGVGVASQFFLFLDASFPGLMGFESLQGNFLTKFCIMHYMRQCASATDRRISCDSVVKLYHRPVEQWHSKCVTANCLLVEFVGFGELIQCSSVLLLLQLVIARLFFMIGIHKVKFGTDPGTHDRQNQN